MLRVVGRCVALSRGDTGRLRLTFTGLQLTDDDVIIFTVRPLPGSYDKIIEKRTTATDNVAVVVFTPDDTQEMTPFRYAYDVRILKTIDNGTVDVLTPYPPAAFDIVEVIGDGK